MKSFVRLTSAVLLSMMSAAVLANEEAYRIAGIIASGTAGWQAIIELPDGEQKLVSEGDFLDQVEIVRIVKDGVVLQFPGGARQMKLSEGGYIPLATDVVHELPDAVIVDEAVGGLTTGAGVVAGDFSKQVEKQLTAHQVASVRGLEILSSLSESARLVAYSYLGDAEAGRTPINSVNSAVNLLQQAIIEGKDLRISVEGDDNILDFYVMPN